MHGVKSGRVSLLRCRRASSVGMPPALAFAFFHLKRSRLLLQIFEGVIVRERFLLVGFQNSLLAANERKPSG